MAVETVAEHITGSEGSVSGRGGSVGTLDLTCAYRVVCDNKTDTAEDVLKHFFNTPSLPYSGRPFRFSGTTNTAATCTKISAKQVERAEPHAFIVTATHSTPESEDSQRNSKDGKKTDNPLDWHHDIDVSSTQISIPMEKAFYIGQANNVFLIPGNIQNVVNSAGEPFDPLPEYEVDITVLRITKFNDSWDEAVAKPLRGTINNDNVQINKQDYNFRFQFDPFTAKIKEYSGTFMFENGIKYWRETLEVWINPFTWRFELLDAGTMAYKPRLSNGGAILPPRADDIPQRLVDESEYPITSPMPLNGNGFILPKGQPPVFLTYSKYKEVPYANINW